MAMLSVGICCLVHIKPSTGKTFLIFAALRRPARVVEEARLESVYTGNRIEGSNPSVSAMDNERFFVYVLQSMKDFSFYIGQCADLDRRMSKHSDGFSKYTSRKRPWRLVYFEMFTTRKEFRRPRQAQLWKLFPTTWPIISFFRLKRFCTEIV